MRHYVNVIPRMYYIQDVKKVMNAASHEAFTKHTSNLPSRGMKWTLMPIASHSIDRNALICYPQFNFP
jgi:hypothetical protein